MEYLSDEDSLKHQEILIAAVKALKARILFWDNVLEAIKTSRKNRSSDLKETFQSRNRDNKTRIFPGSRYGKNEQQPDETNKNLNQNINQKSKTS